MGLSYPQISLNSVTSHIPNIFILGWFSLTMTLKGSIGEVSYLSMYLPRLQLLLQPLHKISSKKADFVWSQEHQVAYDAIVKLLVKPPVLSLPINNGLFRLYCDTSHVRVGASLWQVQESQEHLLAYFSNASPKATIHYGICKLAMTRIIIAVIVFCYLFKNTVF